MRRFTMRSRLLAAVMAPWFALVMAEPAALHTCAVHSAGGMGQGDTGAHAHAGAISGGETPSHADGMAHEGVPTTPPGHHGHHDCTCPSGCCPASPILIASPAALSWLPASVRRESPTIGPDRPHTAADDYVLPFANGPPTVA